MSTTTLPLAGSAAELRSRIAGTVVTPADPAYDELRLAWNRSYEHHPALVVVPASAADVAVAVRYAASTGMPVAVQATGHGVARPASGGMLLLTHRLDEVAVDAGAWTARIGAGAKWEKVLGPATAAGLAPLLGSTPDVSAVGYTLGGGMGWLARKYGLSADHVRSFEIVTADGAIRRASPDSEPDLFWALRGGGAGSLGVVTAMEIDLVPVESLYAGTLLYPAELAREVAARYREWVEDVPDELTSGVCFMNFPPLDEVPEPIRGRSIAIVRGAFVGTDEAGEELLRYWRDWRPPDLDLWGRMPFSEVAAISNDPVDPMPALVTTEWLDDFSDGAIDVLAATLFEQDGPSPLLFAQARHCGGAIGRAPEHGNAYGNRARRFVLECVAVTQGPGGDPALAAFLEQFKARLAPHAAGGAYLNFLEGEERLRRSPEAFEPEAWQRLRRIKAAVDPGNLFSHGVAIA